MDRSDDDHRPRHRLEGAHVAEERCRADPYSERAGAPGPFEEAPRPAEPQPHRAIAVEAVGVVFFNLDGRIVHANDAFLRMCGHGRQELRGALLWERITPPEFRDVTERAVVELAERGEAASYEKQLIRKDGSRFWGLFAPTRLSGSGCEADCAELVIDISASRRMQAQREQQLADATAARTLAEEANRAKDEFLATLSHEMRTPLAPILLWGRALRAGQVPPQDCARAIDAIVESAESQSRLIEDLLDLSRVTSGRLLLARSATDVGTVARATLEIVRPSAEARRIALSASIDPELGCPSLDSRRFQQILWNLLSNAVKFTPDGGRVSLRLRKVGEAIEATVSDTGQGIAPEFLPHLFERFRQADMGDSRTHGGLGIGLALTRQLVELHGGTVAAHSDGPDRGAAFVVTIPWVAARSGESDEAAEPARGGVSVRGLRVLLVEDHADTRESMAWVLERVGAHVRAVGCAAEALAVIDQAHAAGGDAGAPEVMVCDLGLPEMDGYELVGRVIERYRARGQTPIPACAVSAHARAVDRRRAIDAGFDIYVAKPVSAEKLVEAVEELALVAGRGEP